MAYCTVAELTDRYSQSFLVQLSDRADTPAVGIDTGLFDRAIADADALIDGYLKTRYALPLASTPPIVKHISQRVAIYNAHGQTVADKIRDDYKLALGQLKDIAAGTIKLDVAGVEPEASGSLEVLTNEPGRPFTADKMKGFI